MQTQHLKINWDSPNVLQEIVSSIEVPLATIIKANQERSDQLTITARKDVESNIIFYNSKQIEQLIAEIVEFSKSKAIQVSNIGYPGIFTIYKENEHISALYGNVIKEELITKSEKKWLYNFEQEAYIQMKKNVLNLYDLAYTLSVSERQLHRKINKLVQLTPNKYIRILKMAKAKTLLEDTVYDTVSEVSYAVGYYDTHYFTKLFSKHFGVSPKNYIESIKTIR